MTLNRESIIDHYEHSIEWVQSLMEVTDEEWRRAIADGKWSIAEIIAHFVPWDELILHDRSLPQAPDVHDMNQLGSRKSEKGREKRDDSTICCCQNRMTSRNEENRSISLD
ncbi:DinB family protein [Bacillus xiamenensis]|uniref:DinB family protein n=1 Tax=Bacillus xiamenensis TaxID=1178537 RepID=A0ABT4F3D5_9BACI|nr:DinB family protein [Bacillus xiamenensis]MCY9576561.1 DinB family protein [Bacillus xiamenensis]